MSQPFPYNAGLVWTDRHCHKNVLRAASSFFEGIFSQTSTFGEFKLNDGVEGTLAETEIDGRSLLQVTFNGIDSRSIQSIVNYAYTGCVQVDTDALKRTIDDVKAMNQRCDSLLLHMTKSMCIAVQLSKFFSTIVNFIMSAF